MLAMASVGLWGHFLGRPLIYLLPMVFPIMMAIGAGVGIAGVKLPPVELGIRDKPGSAQMDAFPSLAPAS